jgi:CHRD domain
MNRLYAIPAGILAALTLAAGASSQPAARTFVVKLTAAQERPLCAAADRSDRGVALFKITNLAAGTVQYKVISTNLPGNIVGSPGAHIHGPAPAGQTAGILQPLTLTGKEVGVVAKGTFTNPALVAAALANPQLYYVNVHSTTCPPGVIRGQLG